MLQSLSWGRFPADTCMSDLLHDISATTILRKLRIMQLNAVQKNYVFQGELS